MHLQILLISSVIGVLEVLTCIQAVPVDAIYTGDSCDCPKKLNYFVNMPQPPMSEDYVPSEYGYKLEWPLPAKAKVTYTFDFAVEEPKTTPPAPEVKLDLYGKIDRIMAHKKDCFRTEEESKSCGCHRCAMANRYVSPESSAGRFTRNLRYPKAVEDMAPLSSHIMAIFFEPLKQTKLDMSKPRDKRDLSRIFTRSRKNEKRSDRLVKQYSKRLQNLAHEKTFFDDTEKLKRFRTIAGTGPSGIRPLQQLNNFLNLASLRSKRDIKGEYDLIEKEREQKDLTLPEIIQYMPETLDPNFKRNQCHFGQSCQHNDLSESTTKTTTTMSTSETSTIMTTTERRGTTQNALSVSDTNNIKDEEEEEKMANYISLTHTKRNTGGYSGGCPLVFKGRTPTPNPSFTYEPLTSFEAMPRPFSTLNNPYRSDPVPQQYVGAPQSPYSSAIFDNSFMETASAKSTIQPISNSQLDRTIAAIVRKHSDFIQANSHRYGALVDPPIEQERQAKYFLKSLMAAPWNDWHGEYYHHKP